MANLINEAYFTGARALPTKTDDDLDLLDEFVEEKQNRFFIDLFGYEFQKLMLADPTNPIYSRILTGGEFTDLSGNLNYWEGINESLANYVYCYYNKELVLKRTSIGFSAGNTENGFITDAIKKPVQIWNRIPKAMDVLYQLLSVYSDDYPTLIFTPYESLNEFNI